MMPFLDLNKSIGSYNCRLFASQGTASGRLVSTAAVLAEREAIVAPSSSFHRCSEMVQILGRALYVQQL